MTPKTKRPKPHVRYARVSRVGGRSGEGYISPKLQDRETHALAAQHGVETYPELFLDEDYSGGNLDRPEFQRALELIRSGKAGGIIVKTFDRFSRDTEDALSTLREIEAAGGRLICGDGETSLSNGNDEFMTTVRAAVNAFERRRRADDLDKSVRNAIERGVHLSAPFGYAKGPDSRLVPVHHEAEAVKRMFALRAEGLSWNAVAQALNDSGSRPRPYTRHGIVRQGRWTGVTVRQIVKSETYLGTAHNGERRHPGAHDAIVDQRLFGLANRAKGTKPIGPDDGYLLSGLVRCAGCGYVMTHAMQNGRGYYRCRAAQHGDGRCPEPCNVPAEALEELVAERFEARYLDDEYIPIATDDAVDACEARVAQIAARLTPRLELIVRAQSDTEREILNAQADVDRAELREAEAELKQAQNRARGAADLPPELTVELFRDAPLPQQRHWLSLVYRAIVIRRAAPGTWREPVADRARLVTIDEAPADSTRLISHVAALAV